MANRPSQKEYVKALTEMYNLHAHALTCHCECLGMNAENSVAVCENRVPPYRDADYFATVKKWGLTNDKGEPTNA